MIQRQTEIEALLREAEAGGPGAGLAARRAAGLLEGSDPAGARRALAMAASLSPLDPSPRLGMARLAAEAGDLETARREARTLLTTSVDEAARARAAFMLGEIARALGELTEARTAFTQALKIEESLRRANPTDPTTARWYARTRGRLAELDAASGDLPSAQTGAEGALAMLRATAGQIGETPALAADIADAEMRLGAIQLDWGHASAARAHLQQAIGRYEALVLHEAGEPHWKAMLSDAWALLAETNYVAAAPAEAREAIDKALALRVKLARGDASEGWGLAGLWRTRAALLAALGDAQAATDSLFQARDMAERLFADANQAEAPGRFLTQTLREQSDHALRMGQRDTAREAADSARKIAETFARASNSAPWLSELSACWDRLGEVARAARAPSLDFFARAVEFRRMARDAGPGEPRHQRALAAALIKLGDAAMEARSPHSAYIAYNESAQLRLAAAEMALGDHGAAHALAVALERLGLAAAAEGDLHGARAAWESELELADRIFDDESSIEGQRFFAVIEAHLASLNGPDAADLRATAMRRLDMLAHAGALTERETALRKKLWSF